MSTPSGGGRVVVAVDASPVSTPALRHGAWIAARLGADLDVVAVDEYPPGRVAGRDEPVADRLARAIDVAFPGGTPERLTPTVLPGDPRGVLVERAARADLLVLGDHGPRLVRTAPALGPVAAACVARAVAPVLVVRDDTPDAPGFAAAAPGGAAPPHPFVVGIDGSAASTRALRWAARLAGDPPGEIDCVMVLGSPEWLFLPGGRDLDDDVEAALDGAVTAVLGDGRPGLRTGVDHGDPVKVLVEHSRTAALLVVGSHRHHAVGVRPVSVGIRCAAEAACPVLVVH